MERAVLAVASLVAVTLVCSAADTPTPATASEPSTIMIYDQPNFQGRSVKIDKAVPDLTALNFNDRVASFAITGANDWVLCEHKNYAGRCVRVQSKAQDLKVLQIGGRVSSLYSVPPATTP